MSKGQMLRAFVEQRLTVAAAEIFGLFERTIAEYEEELTRSKEENERQRRQMDAVVARQLRLQRAVVQQRFVCKEEVPLDQSDWSISLDQVDPEPPHVKEEQEKRCTSQEGEQVRAVEEEDVISLTLVSVKSEEDDEERLQSSQLHQRQTEQMETAADGEDCGGPEPAGNSDPDKTETGTQHSGYWKEPRQPQSGLNGFQIDEVPHSDFRWNTGENQFICSECGKIFHVKKSLNRHMKTHTGEKPFPCTVCTKTFAQRGNLQIHMRTHTGEKPFSCSLCNKSFAQRQNLEQHMRTHTGEKPFRCSLCNKSYAWRQNLEQHMRTHTGETFSCFFCDQSFAQRQQLEQHMRNHTVETFSCFFCDQSFAQRQQLEHHMRTHTGEAFSCFFCDQSFAQRQQLEHHMRTHTGE